MTNLATRFYSLFLWGRPPLPADLADSLATVVDDHKVGSVLAVGVTSPTALTALGAGDSRRKLVVMCPNGEWGESYSLLDEDEYPQEFSRYLPVEILTTSDGLASRRFDMVYVDKDFPMGRDFPPEKLAKLIQNNWQSKLIGLGFCQDFPSPIRLRKELEREGFVFKEVDGELINRETGDACRQTFAYATRDAN